MANPRTGLFIVSYEIGQPALGAPSFQLNLTVSTPNETVSGYGEITQPVSPPLDLKTQFQGQFTYMTVMPNNTHILVTGAGYPNIHWPPHGGVGPVMPPNLQLQMVLADNWQSGTANYKYLNNSGEWVSVKDAIVQAVQANVLPAAA